MGRNRLQWTARHESSGFADRRSTDMAHRYLTRRWLLVAPALLLLWITGQVDKTHHSLIVADRPFLQELGLAGHNPELGGLMSAFFVGYGVSIFAWGFLVDRFGPVSYTHLRAHE